MCGQWAIAKYDHAGEIDMQDHRRGYILFDAHTLMHYTSPWFEEGVLSWLRHVGCSVSPIPTWIRKPCQRFDRVALVSFRTKIVRSRNVSFLCGAQAILCLLHVCATPCCSCHLTPSTSHNCRGAARCRPHYWHITSIHPIISKWLLGDFGHCWPSAADEEWHSTKRPSSTVAVNSSELNTKASAFSLYCSFQLDGVPFLPPFAPFVGLDGTASVYALHGTRWQLAPLRWTFPAFRCSDNAGVV